MKRAPACLLLALTAGAVSAAGAWLEDQPWSADLRQNLRSREVPRPLLDIGRLGAILQRNDLVSDVSNDETVFPISARHDPDDPIAFRRKSKVDGRLYRANPSRTSSFPVSALPIEEREHGDWTVVSVALAEDDLHGEDGLLKRYTERIEKRAHVTLYRKGVAQFATRTGLKLHGGGSRLPQRKSSYRLHLRDRYGSTAFPPGLLFEGRVDPVSTVILRRTLGFTSVLAYDLARLVGGQVPHYEPCLLYLNGESQGVHFLTERLERGQLRSRFGHDEFLAYRLRGTASSKSLEARDRLQQWSRELGDGATVERVERFIDVDAMSRYLLTVAFCGTNDWEQGAAVLDLTDPKDRWSWIHWDMDGSFFPLVKDTTNTPAFGVILDSRKLVNSLPLVLFRKLLRNDAGFRDDFAKLTTEVLNHLWTPETLRATAATYGDMELSLGMPSAVYRDRIPFLERRPRYVLEDLRQRLDLGPLVQCEIRAEASGSIVLEVDGYKERTPYRGHYYAGQRLRARVTDEAAPYSGWSVDGVRHPAGPLELVLREDTQIVALRE